MLCLRGWAGSILASTWLVAGCSYDYSCDDDVLACEQGEAFEIVDDCDADEPLILTVLETDTMEPLGDDRWPVIHHGAQGGIHFDLTMEVEGLDPAHEQIQLTMDAIECARTDCSDEVTLGERLLYAGEEQLEEEGDDDDVRLPSVVLLLEDDPSGRGELRVDVLDACGREASLVHRVSG
ncbi:hypothetical protein [Paraliomyxa miuraensis]|uniref:hypothetical protein n=1 Tax=Paraliomyxa miuraensis TaxID=376150 RepID=UPI00224DD456|nr:hypothetical protein [Paraliomyxa miuraensis]MCX4241237.1 hypothetical protein [Paraliomyxa miuraensis]